MDIQDVSGGAPAERHNIRATTLPPGLPTPEEIDALIAKEMSRLSTAEREKALDDLHGIGGVEEEDPAFVISCLEELEDHLTKIKLDTAYALAEAISRQYISAKKFRMMFLRADRYEPKEAAERMIRFFELKKRLFGVQKMLKEITLDDLDDDDVATLKTGCAQVSPCNDMAGRPVAVFLQKLRKYKVPENAGRVAYYVLMSTVESPDAQRSGISLIHYHLDSNSNSVNGELRNSLPIHFASLHLCVNEEKEFHRVCGAIKALTKKSRVRYRTHFGSHAECQYELTSFGIPRNALPMTQEGRLLTNEHMIWLQKRPEMEVMRASKQFSDEGSIEPECPTSIPGRVGLTPSPDDVLFGRGRAVIDHPGNARFRQIIDLYMNKYEASGRLQKTCIAEIIVRMVKDSSGRFLKKGDDGAWDEAADATARKKVAHAFRNRRKMQQS